MAAGMEFNKGQNISRYKKGELSHLYATYYVDKLYAPVAFYEHIRHYILMYIYMYCLKTYSSKTIPQTIICFYVSGQTKGYYVH